MHCVTAPGVFVPTSANNLKETMWQVRWNGLSKVSPAPLPVHSSLPVCSSIARFSSGILTLYMCSHWWGLGYLTQKNLQDLALSLCYSLWCGWVTPANIKSISRGFRLLFVFGLICYKESLWAELLLFGSKRLQCLEWDRSLHCTKLTLY